MTTSPSVPFGVYLHVPFCSSRCGYCDFNTYTPGQLGTQATPDSYRRALRQELELASARLEEQGLLRPADTVFVGGGTPSMLGADVLAEILCALKNTIGIAPGAEVTTESNPESTSPEFFAALLEAGYTRISLGMQSARAHVLQVLDRKHTPGRATAAAREALDAGFEHVNLDMIYGTPTETDDDVRATLDAILATGVDHVSAYSLIVEDGTAIARRIRRGELPPTDDDVIADRYQLIDAALTDAGMQWYEVSNWARPGGACRHNEGYWCDGDWWGAGPGAHSHLGNQRFFNVKHPARYATMLAGGELPISGFEELTPQDRHVERVMLGLRMREGIAREHLRGPAVAKAIAGFRERGLLAEEGGRLALTDRGRLLADGIIADLLVAEEADL